MVEKNIQTPMYMYDNMNLFSSSADYSSTSAITTANTKEIPVSVPDKSWYKNPVILAGISVGGFIVFTVVLFICLTVLSRKLKHRVKPTEDYPLIRVSRLKGVTGSAENSLPSTPDFERERFGIVSSGIKSTESFEMKSMPRLDF